MKTKSILTLAAALLGFAAAAHAIPVLPGDTHPLVGVDAGSRPDMDGLVVHQSLLPFMITDGNGNPMVQGHVNDRVRESGVTGNLVFEPQLVNLQNFKIDCFVIEMRVQGFAPVLTDVEYRNDLDGNIGPDAVERSASGDVLTFRHFPADIRPPQFQRPLPILTDTREFAHRGTVTIIAQRPDTLEIFQTTVGGLTVPPADLIVDPGESIQLAIDSAAYGDTVTVRAGEYNENITMRSGVNVAGEGNGASTITGLGTGCVVTLDHVFDSTLSGFMIRGSSDSAGICINGGTPLISSNIVTGNLTGIEATNGSSAIICGNRINNNGDSGGIFIDHGIKVIDATPLISSNIVSNNESGIFLQSSGSDAAQIINNTVSNNSNDGIWCEGCSPSVKNNISAFNATGISAGSGASPSTSYNNVFSNLSDFYTYLGGSAMPGPGSISSDPLFSLNSPDEYLLTTNSPCIDAGDPAALYNDSDGTRNDIGARGGPCSGALGIAAGATNGFTFTSVGLIPISKIDQAGHDTGLANVDPAAAGSLHIPAWKDAPFGGYMRLYGGFDTGIGSAVAWYTIEVGAWNGGTPPGGSDFRYIDFPLSKTFYTFNGTSVSASIESIGPKSLGLGLPFYERTRNNGAGVWSQENLMVVLNSIPLQNGKHDIRLTAYDGGLNLIPLAANPKLTLEINNTRPVAEITAITRNDGTPVPECAVMNLSSDTENLKFTIDASHADGYLDDYTFSASVGTNRSAGIITSDRYSLNGHDTPGPLWSGLVPPQTFDTVDSMAANTLNNWETCAYQFRVVAWARTTNGFGRIYRDDFFANYAINLGTPPMAGNPDLDGDGDVDGDDLNIFSAAYGQTAK